jgi:predicted Zn-dependent protease
VAGKREPNRARNAGKRVGPRDRDVLPPTDFSHPQYAARRRKFAEAYSLPSKLDPAEVQAISESRAAAGTYGNLVRQAKFNRRRAQLAEFEAVRAGRRLGVSWDRIGEALEVPGETLRRRYAGKV